MLHAPRRGKPCIAVLHLTNPVFLSKQTEPLLSTIALLSEFFTPSLVLGSDRQVVAVPDPPGSVPSFPDCGH